MVAFLPPKTSRILAGIEFRRFDLSEVASQGANLADSHVIAGATRSDGAEITWALPRDPQPDAKCWLAWTQDRRNWYAAIVDAPKFLDAFRAVFDEVAR